eukprot:CAMPEP_0168329870 /NCGR_PEP_ID=MMETSP0213-20121227/7370_1 /TAXON_ID=151035 /ORGANISM="Euplotes harpa, Strain FSP1.4" /LENGTH=107 /DNA_ID=CAMNT_0008333287 /DNA_START=560 /DNA_END=881 /DNA_ORIENTATION=+
MIGGSGGITSFAGLVDGHELDEMRDPESIMRGAQGSIAGYGALHAIEGGHEEAKGYGKGTVAKSSATETTNALDLFRKPHNYGTAVKAITGGSTGVKRGVASNTDNS